MLGVRRLAWIKTEGQCTNQVLDLEVQGFPLYGTTQKLLESRLKLDSMKTLYFPVTNPLLRRTTEQIRPQGHLILSGSKLVGSPEQTGRTAMSSSSELLLSLSLSLSSRRSVSRQ